MIETGLEPRFSDSRYSGLPSPPKQSNIWTDWAIFLLISRKLEGMTSKQDPQTVRLHDSNVLTTP